MIFSEEIELIQIYLRNKVGLDDKEFDILETGLNKQEFEVDFFLSKIIRSIVDSRDETLLPRKIKILEFFRIFYEKKNNKRESTSYDPIRLKWTIEFYQLTLKFADKFNQMPDTSFGYYFTQFLIKTDSTFFEISEGCIYEKVLEKK